jgi:hypothetical protein
MDGSKSKTETPMPGRNQHRRAAPEKPLAGEAQTGDRFVSENLLSVSASACESRNHKFGLDPSFHVSGAEKRTATLHYEGLEGALPVDQGRPPKSPSTICLPIIEYPRIRRAKVRIVGRTPTDLMSTLTHPSATYSR